MATRRKRKALVRGRPKVRGRRNPKNVPTDLYREPKRPEWPEHVTYYDVLSGRAIRAEGAPFGTRQMVDPAIQSQRHREFQFAKVDYEARGPGSERWRRRSEAYERYLEILVDTLRNMALRSKSVPVLPDGTLKTEKRFLEDVGRLARDYLAVELLYDVVLHDLIEPGKRRKWSGATVGRRIPAMDLKTYQKALERRAVLIDKYLKTRWKFVTRPDVSVVQAYVRAPLEGKPLRETQAYAGSFASYAEGAQSEAYKALQNLRDGKSFSQEVSRSRGELDNFMIDFVDWIRHRGSPALASFVGDATNFRVAESALKPKMAEIQRHAKEGEF